MLAEVEPTGKVEMDSAEITGTNKQRVDQNESINRDGKWSPMSIRKSRDESGKAKGNPGNPQMWGGLQAVDMKLGISQAKE